MRKEKNRRFAILITVMILLLILALLFQYEYGLYRSESFGCASHFSSTWNSGGDAGAV